jgi:hypothetical protein
LDTVTDQTGVFFDEPGVDGLCEGLRSLDDKRIDPAACRRNAERFAADIFDREITRHVSEMIGKS